MTKSALIGFGIIGKTYHSGKVRSGYKASRELEYDDVPEITTRAYPKTTSQSTKEETTAAYGMHKGM